MRLRHRIFATILITARAAVAGEPADPPAFALPLGGRKIEFKCSAINGLKIPPYSLQYNFVVYQGSDGAARVISATGTTFPNYEIWQYGGGNSPAKLFDYKTNGSAWDLRNGPQSLPLP